ncbi:hypothetical protein KI387_003579, partial [Taxus chinensis]
SISIPRKETINPRRFPERTAKTHFFRLKANTIFNEAVKNGFEDGKVLGAAFRFGQKIIH